MARFKTTAGYFNVQIEKQLVKVKQMEHVKNDSGEHMFESDGVKPVMREIMVDVFVDVPVQRWIDQVDVPFSKEEEDERDCEEALHEHEKLKPVALTAEDEMTLLIEEGAESVKKSRESFKSNLMEWERLREPLQENLKQKQEAVSKSLAKV